MCSKYQQSCALGNAGYASVIAVICYMIAQSLVCCSPRPPPFFNLCKKTPARRKKKKKVPDEEEEGLNRGYDDPDYEGRQDSFRDEPVGAGYVDPYDDATQDDYDHGGNSYMDPSTQGSGYPTADEHDVYSSAYDNDTYARDPYGGGTHDDGTYEQSYEGEGHHDDGTYEDGDESYYTEGDGTEYDSHHGSQPGYSGHLA